MVELKFHVKLPIFVARQWIRHRSASVNEYSGRYSVMKEEFYLPASDDIRYQSAVNKQGRSSEQVPEETKRRLIDFLNQSNKATYGSYHEYVEQGLARELARINLPLSMYTEWYWKIDLHNLFHFLRLRLDVHAQIEIRQYARVMANMVQAVCPVAYEAFEDYVLDSLSFSRIELRVLKDLVGQAEFALEGLLGTGLSKREAQGFLEKIKKIRDI
jgi:thymidylate synthase (FAD)